MKYDLLCLFTHTHLFTHRHTHLSVNSSSFFTLEPLQETLLTHSAPSLCWISLLFAKTLRSRDGFGLCLSAQFLIGSYRNLINYDESHGKACCRIKKTKVEGRNEKKRRQNEKLVKSRFKKSQQMKQLLPCTTCNVQV